MRNSCVGSSFFKFQFLILGQMNPKDVAETLSCSLTADGSHRSKVFALSSLFTHCLPAVRRALCRSEEVLPQAITPTKYANYMSNDGQGSKEIAIGEETINLVAHFFNRWLHIAHAFEVDGTTQAGNEELMKRAVMVRSIEALAVASVC